MMGDDVGVDSKMEEVAITTRHTDTRERQREEAENVKTTTIYVLLP